MIKTSTAAAGLALLVFAAPADAQQAAEDANAKFDRILDEATTELFQIAPIYASMLSVSEEEAGGRYKDRFGTPGIEGYNEMEALTDRIEARLETLNVDELTPERREWLAILMSDQQVAEELDTIEDETGYYLAGSFSSPYVVTQIGGAHVDLPQFMTQLHGLSSQDDADAYIARLEQFDEQFEGVIELLEANAEAGAVPPAYAVEGAIRNAELFIEPSAEENVLSTHLVSKLADLGIEDAEGYEQRVTSAVENSVYPAYRDLIASLEALREQATPEAGVWDIPEGEQLYNVLIRSNGESKLSGEEVHELGLREVARIQGEMEAIFEDLGMTEGTIGERLIALTEDPEQIFPNTPEGKEELLAYVRRLTAEAEEVMGEYFLVTPESSVVVQPVPEYAQEGAPGGSYMSPAEDGSRPGMFMINLRDTAAQPKWSLPTLTYHETVPGHHFQLALATDAKDTPLLVRQMASSTGFAEGWGLYSEAFAKEIGLYEDDQLGDLGRLRDELFRAVRLVVDSGMHAKQWSRDEAIKYMRENTGMERSDVKTEIERYSVWPGQALAYKTGMLKIQALRERAEEALGEDFDVAVFHYEVLRDGGAPLDVLEERIERWIEMGGPAPELG
ncbi:DUF885 domain-containing protein [Parvularcula oceani]|uniref:DUF885 domain-containing protein n=1 Tax=Parvularcula oceani TaxID=1247963 RepID=UPI00068C8F85|nr:DUF885 domain-containing protein [Parvularcula oceani]